MSMLGRKESLEILDILKILENLEFLTIPSAVAAGWLCRWVNRAKFRPPLTLIAAALITIQIKYHFRALSFEKKKSKIILFHTGLSASFHWHRWLQLLWWLRLCTAPTSDVINSQTPRIRKMTLLFQWEELRWNDVYIMITKSSWRYLCWKFILLVSLWVVTIELDMCSTKGSRKKTDILRSGWP